MEGIPRCEVEEHQSKDCPLQEVKCKYSYVGCEMILRRKEMDTHMDIGMKEHLRFMENYAEQLKCEKESAESDMEKCMINFIGKLSDAKRVLRRNCVYTESVWDGCLKTCVFYPLYGPGYRIQMWISSSSTSGQMAVTIDVLAPKLLDFGLTWPLKAIVTVELADPIGRLEPVCQSKRGIWYEPRCRQTAEVSFDPFMSWIQSNSYVQGRDRKLTFNIYLCQPEKHPDER